MALSSLTLLADARKLYRMRNADLPSPYMKAYHAGLVNAQRCGTALVSHIEQIDSPEQPAVIADFLLRWDEVHWSLVTASNGKSLMLSLRTDGSKLSAAAVMKRLVRQLGEGGGHRNKAGGNIPLPDDKAETLARLRNRLRLRLLRAVGLAGEKPVRLIARS